MREVCEWFERLITGRMDDDEMRDFLVANPPWKLESEDITKMAGMLYYSRLPIVSRETPNSRIMDICGTGGGGQWTFNVSTAVAFVVAAAGWPVVKYGNVSHGGGCGSMDVLEALGVDLGLSDEYLATCLDLTNLAFVAASTGSVGSRVAAVRRSIKTPTIFNVVGPLTNPARPEYRLLGVYSADMVLKMAMALKRMDVPRFMVVCGESDGKAMDEISTTGPTNVIEHRDGVFHRYTLNCVDLDVPYGYPEDYAGTASAIAGAVKVRSVLSGNAPQGAIELAVANAAAALYLRDTNQQRPFKECAGRYARFARRIIHSGGALQKLDELIRVTKALRDCQENDTASAMAQLLGEVQVYDLRDADGTWFKRRRVLLMRHNATAGG